MDFNSAKDLVDGSNILKLQRGGTKSVIDEEKPVIDFAYSSVVSIKTIHRKKERFFLSKIYGLKDLDQVHYMRKILKILLAKELINI